MCFFLSTALARTGESQYICTRPGPGNRCGVVPGHARDNDRCPLRLHDRSGSHTATHQCRWNHASAGFSRFYASFRVFLVVWWSGLCGLWEAQPINYLLGGCFMDHTSAKCPEGSPISSLECPGTTPNRSPGSEGILGLPSARQAVEKKNTRFVHIKKNKTIHFPNVQNG